MSTHRRSIRHYSLGLLPSLVIVVAILYLAKVVVVPLAMAILLTFILTPIVSTIQRIGIGRVAAVILTVAFTLTLLGFLGWGVGHQVNLLARELPEQKDKIQKKVNDIRGSDSVFSRVVQMVREISEESTTARGSDGAVKQKEVLVARQQDSTSFGKLTNTVAPVLEPLAMATLVIILVVFMLIRREDLRNRLIGLWGRQSLTGTTRMMVEATSRLSRFLLTQTLINIGFGIVFAMGLLVIGVPYAILWGFLAAILRYIPFIGTWICASFPLILSFALAPDWTQPLTVLGFFIVIEIITANFIEPLFIGRRTGVTPITLLIAVVFWTWLWGPIGLVLSTPLTVCLVVLSEHIPKLRFMSLLMGDRPALPPYLSFYQRLLAKDEEEAQKLAREHSLSGGLESVCDVVLLPALVLAQRDLRRGDLSAEEVEYILQTTYDILTDVEKQTVAPQDPPATEPKPALTALPKLMILNGPRPSKAEEISTTMLVHIMKTDGYNFKAITPRRDTIAEYEAQITAEKPVLVIIPIIHASNVTATCRTCQRLRKRFADLPIIVGYWPETRRFAELTDRLLSAGATQAVISLRQMRKQIQNVLHE